MRTWSELPFSARVAQVQVLLETSNPEAAHYVVWRLPRCARNDGPSLDLAKCYVYGTAVVPDLFNAAIQYREVKVDIGKSSRCC